jgi:anaerobic ribonucleoside-triphosphate reductase activating protein
LTLIAISRVHYPISTLGPGRRIGIWFQGCSIRCPGCVSVDTWAPGRITRTVVNLLEEIEGTLREAEGVTISGGEPFDQPDALSELLHGIRARTTADILVFSGHPLEKLEPRLRTLDGLIDCVVADPFDEEAAQTLLLRGSDNQRMRFLTKLGQKRFELLERPSSPNDRVLDVVFDDVASEAFLVGIPRRGDMRRLLDLLAADWHSASTTEHRQPTR